MSKQANPKATQKATKKTKLAQRVGTGIVKLRVPIVIIFAIALMVLGYFSTQFKVDASADTLLTKNNELYIQTQVANQKFSPEEFILIAYQPESGDVFTNESINDLQALSKDFKKLERVKTINSMLTVPLIQTSAQLTGGAEVTSLNYENQQYSLQELRALLTDHPIYTDLLVNKKQDAAAIQLVFESNEELDKLNSEIVGLQKKTLDGELTQSEEARLEELSKKASVLREEIGKTRIEEVEQIEGIITQQNADASVYIGGSYVVGIRLVEIVKQDLVYFGAGIFVLISLLLLALFRSLKWWLFPVFACASSVAITTGILALVELPATVISANFIALQIILTLAIMLHLISCYRQISRDNTSLNQTERIEATLAEKLAPCFFAALTTSVGFGSLVFSGIQPVIDFGIMMLISNVVILCVGLLLFPALLSFFPSSEESNEHGILKNGLHALGERVKESPIKYSTVPLVFLAILSFGITKLTVENSFIDYFHSDTKIYQELSFIDQEFGGSTPLDIIIDMDESTSQTDLFISAEQVNKLHLAHATLDAFDASGNVTSLINFTTLAKQLNDGKPLTEYELDVIYSLVDKQVIDSLIGSYLDVESSTLRVSARVEDTLPNLNRADFLSNLEKDLTSAGFSSDSYMLTNLFVLYQDILSRLFDSQIKTLGIVYLAIFFVLLAIFRSLKLALIGLVPNIVTTTAILGIIGWTGIPLDLMTITIAAIAMGIAIDDTIHFIDAYISGGDSNENSDPMKRAFSHTGLAILYTSTLISLGFSMFVFSDFMPSVYFGVLTASAMLLALVTDLSILPGLLKKFVRIESKA